MTLLDKLKNGKTLISDGSWGTFLQQKGLQAGDCPELWNVERPDDVLEIAKSYVDAGSDMIETNSFGGSRYKLEMYGLQDKVYELNKAAAEISRKAAGPDKTVLGSIGPTGKLIMMGDVTEDDLYNAFKEQSMALEEGGADALVIETMSDITEAACAIKASKKNTKCTIICTMTFEKSAPGQYNSMMGATPTEMVEQLIPLGVDIIGANCGNGIEGMIEIVKEVRNVNKEIPILVHANAGIPQLVDGETVFPESPDQMASCVGGLIDAGANIIGGCCGTFPEHIKKMVEIAKDSK